MAQGGSLAEIADTLLYDLFSSWNIFTTLLVILLFAYLIYPLLTWKDPDVHPFLLARQAAASPIRQSGESPVYRAIEIPYGYPLRAGLGVKDPGAPKWSSGRDGDLRDIWRRAVQGPLKDDGSSTGSRGRMITVLGRQKIVEHDLDDLTRGINAIGKHINEAGATKVAICLSNSVELLQSIFAAAFYNGSSVVVPYGLQQSQFTDLLTEAQPDILIAEAGSIELSATVSACPKIKNVIWVTKPGSEHMDWSETPEGTSASFKVATWRDLQQPDFSSEVPAHDKGSQVGSLSTFWPTGSDKFELVEYTSKVSP